MMKKQRLTEYFAAGGILALAITVSPLAIMFMTGREDLSFRVGVPSTVAAAFLLSIACALATRGCIRRLFFYVIVTVTPLALLAALEMAAISLHLADRVAPLEDHSTLLHLDMWPIRFHTQARWLPQSDPPRYRPWKGDAITINGLGLRTAVPTPKAPREWRIAITGGSTVFGWGVFDADTIPAQLATVLHRHGRTNLSVYNFGIDSAGIDQERALLEQFATIYGIDQVIFYTGGNDATLTYLTELGGPFSRRVHIRAIECDEAPQSEIGDAFSAGIGTYGRRRAAAYEASEPARTRYSQSGGTLPNRRSALRLRASAAAGDAERRNRPGGASPSVDQHALSPHGRCHIANVRRRDDSRRPAADA